MEDIYSRDVLFGFLRPIKQKMLKAKGSENYDLELDSLRVELINTLDSAAKATKILMTEAERDDKVFNQIRLTKISFDLGEFANGIRLLDSKKFETFLVLISEDSELSFSDFIFQANNL
ncbi:MAG: hypothetical protein ACKOW9_04365 [Candidatus Paceibacterota bacterium]